MRATVRLTELEAARLEALALDCTVSDVLREGLDLVWKRRGDLVLAALKLLDSERAARLRRLEEEHEADAETG